MTCREAQDLIEAVASGDLAAAPAFASHVAECRDCARSLAAAVAIERALAGQPAPAAPVNFSQAVAVAIRRRRWRDEEQVDRAFNVTIGIAVLAVAIGIVSLFHVSGLAQLLLVAVDTVSEIPQQPPPWASYSLPVTAITAAFVATAVAVWWWAERRPGYGEP